jgi:hypothetical protein
MSSRGYNNVNLKPEHHAQLVEYKKLLEKAERRVKEVYLPEAILTAIQHDRPRLEALLKQQEQ